MFCPNCGANMPDNAKFCAGCGHPMPSADPLSGSSGQVPLPPPKKKKTGLIIGLVCLVAVLLIAIAAILLLDRPGTNKNEKQAAGGKEQNAQAGQRPQASGEDPKLPADTRNTIPLLASITGSNAENNTTCTYTADGFHLSACAYMNGSLYQTTESDYDPFGRVVHSLQQITDQGVTIERDYQYDENGNLVHTFLRQTMEEMPEDEATEDITYTYDSGGTVTQMTSPPESNRVYELEFNPDGTVKAVKAGFTDTSAFSRTEFQYEDGCIASSHLAIVDSDGHVGFEQELVYDKSSRSIAGCGNVLKETTRSNDSEYTRHYEYTDAILTKDGILIGETKEP